MRLRAYNVFVGISMLWVAPIFADIIDESDDGISTPAKRTESLQGLQKPGESKKGALQDDDGSRGAQRDRVDSMDAQALGAKERQRKPENSKRADAKSHRSGASEGSKEPVKFWSKELSGQKSKGILILEENVVVTQADMRLEADKATLTSDIVTNEYKTVVAVGNVKFSGNDPETNQPVRAEAREAVFDNIARTVLLKGDPKFWRGKDLVRGRQINYDLKTGWVKADRVEGVVQSGSQTIEKSDKSDKQDKGNKTDKSEKAGDSQ